jgi:lipid-A-disaccharide synthase
MAGSEGKALCVMLVAAEPSGDALGAGLIRALRRRLGDGVRFVGIGGSRMAAEGLDSAFDISDLAIFGWIEGLRAYKTVVARADETAAVAAREKPDVAVLIDSWGFTLRVAQRLKAQNPDLKVIKYVAPQVWASRPGRAKTLAATVDHLLSILSFDAPYFERVGLPVTPVGNPTLARDFSQYDPDWLRAAIGAGPDDDILLVLPGSRPGEIARLMGPFGDAVARVKQGRPNLHVALALADSVAEQARAAARDWTVQPYLIEGEKARYDAMRGATLTLAASGTVATEVALAGSCMVIAYKVSWITYVLLKLVATTKLVCLINIAAKREIVPEMIQYLCTGPQIARKLAERLDSPALRARQAADQTEALALLGPKGGADPSERAADAVIAIVQGRAP